MDLEAKIKAKIPGEDTGIEIKHTVCAICSPGGNCGINAYIKDGKVIKIEGTDEHVRNHGVLCTKGLNNRQYIYSEDRILTPLKRVGKKGSGEFIEITWEEAYKEIADKLLKIKKEDGADAVAFFGGYNKWYRPWLKRLAHSFGTMNYGTESSTCMTAGQIARKLATGGNSNGDMKNTELFLAWAFNGYYSGPHRMKMVEKRKEEGMKIIIIDPRITPSVEKLADLYLRPYPGTDGALALCMANILIENNWIDQDYIEKYVYGFEEYKEYVKQFNQINIESITGVSYELVLEACRMIHESHSMCINDNSAPIPHHINGVQNYRAIMALSAITGNFDQKGGQLPSHHTFTHISAGYETLEEKWSDATEPKEFKQCVGSKKFPLWFYLEREMQVVELPDQILTKKPYPIKALFALGLNYRMLPDSTKVKEALLALDFFVDGDLFMTPTAKLADIVLPVCSSFERSEYFAYASGYGWLTKPAIDRVGDSKSDTEIICDLANAMNLDDEDLKAGYLENLKYMLSELPITIEELKNADLPMKIPGLKPYQPGTLLKNGFPTKTGKYEIHSSIIADHPEWNLDPLPTYYDPYGDDPKDIYPMILCSGGRLKNALHSRLHRIPWARSLRKEAMIDISLEDAKKLHIQSGDLVEVGTPLGKVQIKANPSYRIKEGVIHFYHGYDEADVNSLISNDHTDPYSGFPGYNSTRCYVKKVKENV